MAGLWVKDLYVYLPTHIQLAQIYTSCATSCLDVRGFPPIATDGRMLGRPEAEKQWGFGDPFPSRTTTTTTMRTSTYY